MQTIGEVGVGCEDDGESHVVVLETDSEFVAFLENEWLPRFGPKEDVEACMGISSDDVAACMCEMEQREQREQRRRRWVEQKFLALQSGILMICNGKAKTGVVCITQHHAAAIARGIWHQAAAQGRWVDSAAIKSGFVQWRTRTALAVRRFALRHIGQEPSMLAMEESVFNNTMRTNRAPVWAYLRDIGQKSGVMFRSIPLWLFFEGSAPDQF